MEEKRWVSCCRGRRSNCPEVSKGKKDTVFIRDDYGNEVELPINEALNLKDLPDVENLSIYGKGTTPVRLSEEQLHDVIATIEELI